jgi:hypothetical protein
VVTAKTLPRGSISLAVTVPLTVGSFEIVIVVGVVGLVAALTQGAVLVDNVVFDGRIV